MEKLGDNTDESFALRNDNEQQLECLQAEDPSGKCQEWMGCMGSAEKQTLKAILLVVVMPTTSLFENASASIIDLTPACIDPHNYDPEAAECECFHDIQDLCAHQTDEHACLLQELCAHSSVCSAWTLNKCPASLARASAIVASGGSLLIQRSQVDDHNAELGNTEDALTGKCTTETRS